MMAGNQNKWYTVVGSYDDEDQTWVGCVFADRPTGAAFRTLRDHPDLDCVIAVFRGRHEDVLAEYLDVGQVYRRIG